MSNSRYLPPLGVLLVGLLLLPSLGGCSEGFESEAIGAPPVLGEAILYGEPDGYERVSVSGVDAQMAAENGLYAQLGLGELTRSAETWQEADHEVRAYLERNEHGVAIHILQQDAARMMLDEWLLKPDAPAESREALGYYTGLLVQNRNPDARRLSQAITLLEGTWSETHLREASAHAIAAYDAWQARGCEGCNLADEQVRSLLGDEALRADFDQRLQLQSEQTALAVAALRSRADVE